MEAMKLVSLPSTQVSPSIRVEGDRLLIDRLTIADGSVAAFVGDRAADERPALIERALRIGLTALQEAGVTVNVDVVRREFEAMLSQTQATNDKAARALD